MASDRKDEFEQRYATGEGRVFFRDKVPIPSRFLWLIGGGTVAFAGAVLALFGPVMGAAIGIGVGAFGLLANLALMGLRVVVSDGGVDVFVGVMRRRIALADIERVELGKYEWSKYPLGRGVMKLALDGSRAYISDRSVSDGVILHLAGGKTALITSHDPQGLAHAIARAKDERVRVEVEPATAAAAEVEIAASSSKGHGR